MAQTILRHPLISMDSTGPHLKGHTYKKDARQLCCKNLHQQLGKTHIYHVVPQLQWKEALHNTYYSDLFIFPLPGSRTATKQDVIALSSESLSEIMTKLREENGAYPIDELDEMARLHIVRYQRVIVSAKHLRCGE